MLDTTTKQKIDSLRKLLVGKVPDPKSQVEQITVALFYKFMWDRDKEIKDLGGNATFFVGEFEKYSWDNLFAPDLGGSDRIKLYSEAIEEMENNPNIPSIFRDIFKRAFLPYNDPYTLKLFLSDINDFHYSNSEKLGDGFEYLLSILGTQGDAGQFRTPRHIIDFITEVVNPKKEDKICDPACGTAGFIISAYKHILKTNTKESLGDLLTPEDKKRLGNNLVGLDIDPMMVKLALANMYLHGLNEPHIYEYDSLTSEERWDDMFDVVLANPPFMTPSGGIRPHKRFAVNATKAEVLFTSYINTHLSSTGRAGIIVPEGIIFQSGNAYKELRKQLIESSLIGVISLPGGVFNPYSGVKTSILLLDKEINKKTDKIFFAKVENDGFDLGAQRTGIDKNDLPRIAKAINEHSKNIKTGITENNIDLNYVLKKDIIGSVDIGLSFERYNEIDIKSSYEIIKLEDIFTEIKNGKNVKQFDSEGKYRVSRIQTIFDGKFNKELTKWTNDEVDDNYFLKKGDILFSHINSFKHLAKTAVFDDNEKIVHGANLIKLRPNFDLVLPLYCLYVLKTDKFRNNAKRFAQKAVNQASINTRSIRNLEIPLPSLEVQKEIVEELVEYQKVIDGAKQVVDNYKPHFEIDESWDQIKIENIGIINNSTYKHFEQEEYIYIDVSSVGKGNGLIDHSNIINSSDLPSRAKRKIKKGSVIISSVRPNLKGFSIIDFNPKNHVVSTGFMVLDVNEKFDNRFIYYSFYTKNVMNQMIARMGKGSYPSINQADFKELSIHIPSIEQQVKIADRLDFENSIVQSNKKLIEIYSKKIENRINKIWGE